MNKNDIKLLIVVILIIIILFILIYFNNDKGNIVKVYYENDLIKTINLKTNNIYYVNGYNGEVVIEVKDNMIRVISEKSENNLCSKQGFIKNKGESITCLPNKIIITIVGNIDTVVE